MKKKKEVLDPLIAELSKSLLAGKPLTGINGVFAPLIKKVLEASLEGEMDAHLQDEGRSGSNRRNGKGRKNLSSSFGGLEIFTPRDRNGSFSPEIVKKRQRRISEDIDTKIISLFGKGMSYRDIQGHLLDLYGTEISLGTINSVTDRLLPEIQEWQQRPLDSVYPIMWLDAMHFKCREHGKVITKAVYSILGVNRDGEKEILGVYFGENESSSFWRQVLYELQSRGVKDIFVACIDNLSGFGDAIEDMFPKTEVQLCLVHQMRNSMSYMSEVDQREMVSDLKKIYTALNAKAAEQYLSQAEEKWGLKYKTVFRSWRKNWERLIVFYNYPIALRKVIYTTNPIEGFHRMVRKFTKTKGSFTCESALAKQIYLATLNAQVTWKGKSHGWMAVKRELAELYGNRFLTDDTVN